ncbi:MAG: YfhO family protein [Patescibacteria group bacterium]
MKYYILNELKAGSLNLWNPYIFSGVPQNAFAYVGEFYPLNLLLIPFSKLDISFMYWLMEISAIFHLFLGGIFMYILTRYLKISHYSSLLAATFFSLSPFFIVHLKHINIIESAIWLPLIFLFFHRALHTDNLKDSIWSGLFMGISILAGHIQINYLMFLFLFAYFIYFLIVEKNAFPGKMRLFILKKTALALPLLLLGLGISAIGLLPAIELNDLSIRPFNNSFSFYSSYSLNPLQFFLTSLFPHFFGGQSETSGYWGGWNYWELTSYLGIVPLIFILIAVPFFKNQKFIKFLFITALLSLFLSFGYHFFPYYVAYFLLPGIQLFRAPARFLFLYNFSLIIIAGFALDFFLANKEKIKLCLDKNKKNILKIIHFAIMFFLILGIMVIILPKETLLGLVLEPSKEKNLIITKGVLVKNLLINFTTFFLMVSALIIIISKYLKQSVSLKFFKISILFLAFTDLFLFGFQFNNSNYGPKDYFPKTKEIEYIEQNNLGNKRIITNGAIHPNNPLVYKFQSIEGNSSHAMLLRYYNFINEAINSRMISSLSAQAISANRLKLLNACYFISNNDNGFKNINNTDLYEIPQCFDRAFIARSVEIEENDEKTLTRIDDPDFNPLKNIILKKKPGLILPNNDFASYNDKVDIVKYAPDTIEIKAELEENGILFLSEVYYPGWEAYIDGVKTEIYEANYLFRAIELQKGNHNIKFIYNPKSFKTGLIISIISLTCAITSLLYLSILKRKNIKN